MQLLYVPVAVCVSLFVCLLQTASASPLRPIGDVTETAIHQAADVEVMVMHQCE